MRSNRGVTLTSLIIYMIVFSIVIGTVATLSGYFTKNLDDVVISSDTSEQYTRLTTYITNDINSINFKEINIKENYLNISFVDGSVHHYIYKNNDIYFISYNKENIDKEITLCNNVTDFKFEYTVDNQLKISITIDGLIFNNNYSIK